MKRWLVAAATAVALSGCTETADVRRTEVEHRCVQSNEYRLLWVIPYTMESVVDCDSGYRVDGDRTLNDDRFGGEDQK